MSKTAKRAKLKTSSAGPRNEALEKIGDALQRLAAAREGETAALTDLVQSLGGTQMPNQGVSKPQAGERRRKVSANPAPAGPKYKNVEVDGQTYVVPVDADPEDPLATEYPEGNFRKQRRLETQRLEDARGVQIAPRDVGADAQLAGGFGKGNGFSKGVFRR